MEKLLKLSLQIELLKARRSAIIIILLLAIYQSLSLPLVVKFNKVPAGSVDTYIYNNLIVEKLFFYVLMAIMIIVAYSIAQEYKEKSLHYQLLNGLSRKAYIFGKLLISLLFGIVLLFMLMGIFVLILKFLDYQSFSSSFIKVLKLKDVLFFIFTVPVFSLLGIFFGRIFSNPIIAIGLIIIYVVVEKALLFFDHFFWNIHLKNWLPLALFGSPEISLQLILTKIVYFIAILGGIIGVFLKKDLK